MSSPPGMGGHEEATVAARKPAKPKVSSILKAKRKGKFAGTARKDIPGSRAATNPLTRYTQK